MKPVLLIHGGVGGKVLRGTALLEYQNSIRAVLESIYPRLQRGRTALSAVIEAVEALENDPRFNAGKGSALQSDGHIRMSSALMDGDRRRFSGCVNVEGVKNPVRLAEKLLRAPDRVLSGEGARQFAREHKLEFASPMTEARRQNYLARKKGKSGTVGAVALDSRGRLAAATSTGGKGFEYPFRVSDSPTCAGNFANRHCAVSATGKGEEIVEYGTAAAICSLVDAGIPLTRATYRLINQAKRDGAQFGVIALDRRGRWLVRTTTQRISWGVATTAGIELLNR